MESFYVLLLFLFLSGSGKAGKLPSTFKTCRRSDPDLNDCFAKAIDHAVFYLAKPIPDLGIPSLDPLKIDSITVRSGSKGAVSLSQKLTNLSIYNLLNSETTKTILTLGTEEFEAIINFANKQYRIESDYEIEGKILVLPIHGKGRAHVNLNDLKAKLNLTGKFCQKKGKTYLKLEEVKFDIVPSKVELNLENLFNGDERLGEEMNKVLNDNWKELFEDVKPGYIEAFVVFFRNVYGAVFDRVPYDELFPV